MKDDWPPSSDIWWQSWKFYFWMYSPMMHANLSWTCCPSADSYFKMLIYSIFYCKCTFEMAVMCLILQETPWKISMQNLHFWNQHQKLKDDWCPSSDQDLNWKFFSSYLAWTKWKMIDPPILTSGGNLGNSTFGCTLQWCMQICHEPVAHQLRVIWKC